MKSVPVSVWLAALVITLFSAYSAWQNPMQWFHMFVLVSFVASFIRVLFFLFEGR